MTGVLRMTTVQTWAGAYMGAQCPHCPAVIQPLCYAGAGQGRSTMAEAMAEHRRVCHPASKAPTRGAPTEGES